MVDVVLRPVRQEDLPILFANQADPEATRMAAFPPRERAAFDAHWARVLADPTAVARTVVADGGVVGNVMSWVKDGERNVGYWFGRAHWGRGLASAALQAFLDQLRERPVVAHVAPHNAASLRVLEKAGFVREPAPTAEGLVRLRLG